MMARTLILASNGTILCGKARARGCRVLCNCQVTIAYSRASEEELDLACGDTIGVLEKKENWWEGRGMDSGAAGPSGWFPKEFVKVVAAKPSEKNGSKAEATSTDGVPEHVLAVFRDLDKDGGGHLCVTELQEGMRRLGTDLSG